LSEIAKRQQVNRVLIESNFGDGMFMQLLKPVMGKVHPVTMEEVKHSVQKEKRIIDTLEPVMNQHRLVVDRRLIEQDYQSTQSLPSEQALRYQLFYQIASSKSAEPWLSMTAWMCWRWRSPTGSNRWPVTWIWRLPMRKRGGWMRRSRISWAMFWAISRSAICGCKTEEFPKIKKPLYKRLSSVFFFQSEEFQYFTLYRNGAEDGARTRNLLLGRQKLYQLSYLRKGPGRLRGSAIRLSGGLPAENRKRHLTSLM
jgi:hypothetical protein